MSFAPAFRKWMDVEKKLSTDDQPGWHIHPETRETIKPFWHRESEILHLVCYDDMQFHAMKHSMMIDKAGPQYFPDYRRAFVDYYVEEEWKFHYVHDFCWINRWRVLENDYVKERTADVRRRQYKILDIQDQAKHREARYCEAGKALYLMRDFIRETIWLSDFPAKQAAIAVPNKEAADYLRKGVGFPGIIVNLEALNYPGMDSFHPVYLAHFRECGMENHMPYTGSWVNYPWSPTWIHRADHSTGFLKCTFRSVAIMRNWTEQWYPVAVAQAKILWDNPQADINIEVYRRFWRVFLAAKHEELCRVWRQGMQVRHWASV